MPKKYVVTAQTTIVADNEQEAFALVEKALANPDSWILNDLLKNIDIKTEFKILN